MLFEGKVPSKKRIRQKTTKLSVGVLWIPTVTLCAKNESIFFSFVFVFFWQSKLKKKKEKEKKSSQSDESCYCKFFHHVVMRDRRRRSQGKRLSQVPSVKGWVTTSKRVWIVKDRSQ
jgi:hypothetical protein